MTTNLKAAHNELFRRTPDETFETLDDLYAHVKLQKENSEEHWHSPREIEIETRMDQPIVNLNNGSRLFMNHWSFSQLCRLAHVSKETVNRLTPQTASTVFRETLSRNPKKPMQFLLEGERLRSLHGTAYTRLWNLDLLNVVKEFATDFTLPQKAATGGSGAYLGEEDLFLFMIDPTGWIEIEDHAFAPGFFLWNSEVGRRSLGIQTFWMQSVCCNHIVWDAVEVIDFTRKHTRNVYDGLKEIRRILEDLIKKRDARKDAFASVIKKAMQDRLGADSEEALKVLNKHGIAHSLSKLALKIAKNQGGFSIFSLVDALTQLSQHNKYAGDRFEADYKTSQLLSLVA